MAIEAKKGRYRHYKGYEYQLIDTVTHSESMDNMVLYRPLYGEKKLWVRPYDMFFEMLTIDGRQVERFKWIAE